MAVDNKIFLRTLFEIVSSKDTNNVNFVESLNLLILINKFCWIENFRMPNISQNKGISLYLFEDESLVSYDEKEIIHSDLSLLTKQHLLNILYHFNIENDNSADKLITIESTFGNSYKPLGNKR